MSKSPIVPINVDQINRSENNEEKILYLFSSTLHPYIKSTVDLLALPPGMDYRFRYYVKRLPEDFFSDEKKTKLITLEKMNALLIHVRVRNERSSEYSQIIEFVPIRNAMVLEAKLVGDFVWIHFNLGDWIRYENPTDNVNVNLYHSLIFNIMPTDSQTHFKYTGIVGKNHDLPICKENFPDENESVVVNWSNLVSYVKSFPEHKKTIFLKLLRINDISGTDKPKPIHFGDFIYGFELQSGKSYQVEFLQRHYGNISEVPFDVKVDTNPDEIITIKSTDVIQGKYDLLRFTIVSEPLIHSRYSFILIRPEERIPTKFLISRPFYNLRIKGQTKKILGLFGITAIGIALAGIGTLFTNWSQIVATILPIAGAIISTISVYFMPKK